MASLPDDTLRKILLQIQQTSIQSQKAHNVSVQQTAMKEREKRILQLTIDEISGIKEDVNMYKGVGKMFMMVPRKEMEQDLKNQEKEITEDISNLNKKSKYLEKQFNEAQAQLRDIFHHAPKQ
ncbi:hypothetical protein E1B28_001670 [Marasmius oreades]|uniref:Prefoldin n=1 Tax=Marasmius oreades TaxID=181124 RepID=A0A9P8AFE7_9AGAR|nr:uncharacterized protein E1B28_001670 [Marasmius oreades]KAG7099866.1 hypothetical protein E1B28_001670 [Marasmius oreades]